MKAFFSLAKFPICLAICFCPQAHSQSRANVGTVIKYTGGPAQMSELKDTNLFLNTLETQIASEAIKQNNVNYIDRSSVNQIFRELNLSSDIAFDSSSGALRGLLGRLDFIVVIDASSPSLARMRGIDLQDGAVRGVATCKRRTFFGSASDGDPDCVKAFMSQLQPSIQQAIVAKKARQDAQAKQQRKLQETQQRAANARAQEQAAREKRDEAAAEAARDDAIAQQEAAQQQAAAQERAVHEIQLQMNAIQPAFEGAIGRLNAADSFWINLTHEMAQRGQSLRSEIQTDLNIADTNGSRCQAYFNNGQPKELRPCIEELNRRLDRLEEYK